MAILEGRLRPEAHLGDGPPRRSGVGHGILTAMGIELRADPVPMAIGPDGVARIAGTRVTLDSLIAAFHEGFGAEEIAQQYPSLTLADVYNVIGYYLHHRSTLDAYLHERRVQSERTRAENETRFSPEGLRARLLARRSDSRA